MSLRLPDLPEVKQGSTSYGGLMSAVEKIRKALLRAWPVDGDGITVTDSIGGFGRQINADPAQSAGGNATFPFKLISTGSTTAAKLRVVEGTINGNIPVGMSAGDTPIYELDVNGTGYVYAVLTCDDSGDINSLSLMQSSNTQSN